MSLPTLSVVIPTYNRVDLLRTCLASLDRNRPPLDLVRVEILVVDDASDDGTAEWLVDRRPDVRLVRLERNGGFARAANAGIKAATGEVIQLLNNDTEVCQGWAVSGLAPFQDSGVGSVAPLVLVRRDPGRVDSAGDQYSPAGWPTKRGHGEPSSQWISHVMDEVFGPSGSSAFFSANAIRRVGAFDERLGAYYEDVDLAFRLRWAGYRCVFQPDSRVLHDISATYRHDDPGLQQRMSRNLELVFWRNLPLRWFPVGLPLHLAFVILQAAVRLRGGRLRPFLMGKLDALRQFRTIVTDRSIRHGFAADAVGPPRFPLALNFAVSLRNHRTRPAESSIAAPHHSATVGFPCEHESSPQ